MTYAPNSGFSGTDSFTYAVSDGQGGSATATVTISHSPSPPPLYVWLSELRWNSGDRKLTGKGSRAPGNVTLTVLDADTGKSLGTVKTRSDGRFKLEMRLPAAPCRIQVRYQTRLSSAYPVTGAPCR